MAISCDPLRQNLKRYIVDTFFDKFDNLSTDTWFLSIGQPNPWPGASSGNSTEDGDVPVGYDTQITETDFWQNTIAHKKLSKDDISLVVPKYDWISGKVYTAYRNDLDLFSDSTFVEFYVVVDEERVYKCIDNSYDAASTTPPTHTDSSIRKLSDGYSWKFLYSISESKRKFITNTSYNALNQIERIGYIPIEYVEFLKLNDDRILQWQVQQAATKGTIDFTQLRKEYQPFLITTNCLISSQSTNTIPNTVSVGATSFNIASNLLYGQNGYYNNMLFVVDKGAGEGQRRVIKSFTLTGSSLGNIVVDPMTVALNTTTTRFSIVPNIKIVGDGVAFNKTLNPTRNTAEIDIFFGAGLSSSSVLQQTYVDYFNMADVGKNYTYAKLEVVAGLTFAGLSGGDINNIGIPVISPVNGHGSDATAELGTASIMVVTDFNQSENGILTTKNDYRQFGLLKSPLLNKKTSRLRLYDSGSPSSFTVGKGITCGATGQGVISYWYPGVSGFAGSAELVVSGVSGNFPYNGIVGSMGVTGRILDVDDNTIAGTESRRLLKLKVASLRGDFSDLGTDFRKGLWVSSVGNPIDSIKSTRFTGSIYRWEPSPISQSIGYLYIENGNGTPLIYEGLVECDYYLRPTGSITGAAKIVDIDRIIEEEKQLYTQTTKLVLSSSNTYPFTNSTFAQDSNINAFVGLTSCGEGKVLEWTNTSSTEGNLVVYADGNAEFVVGAGITFAFDSSIVTTATISSILNNSELKYKTGELEYIQNTTAITRNTDQREEIKILFDF